LLPDITPMWPTMGRKATARERKCLEEAYSQAWVTWKVQELLDAPDIVVKQVIVGIQHQLEERMKSGN